MKKLLILCLFLTGCVEEAQETVQKGNFKLDFLFEQDGCRMYRFMDGSRRVYWSDCSGKTQSDYTTRSGKHSTTHYEETITTP